MEDDLERIALTYHGGDQPDMYIERLAQEYELKWIVSQFKCHTPSILDLGYGDGVNFATLAYAGVLTLVEGSKFLCEQAELEAKRLGLTVEVVHSMFEDYQCSKRFDVILMSHVLEHVDNPVNLLRNMRALLAPEGLIVGIVPNSESLHRRLGVAMGLQVHLDDLSPRDRLVGHKRVYSLDSLETDLASAELTIKHHRGFFVKALANSQLTHLSADVINGLLLLSDDLPTQFCANLGFVATYSSTRGSNV